MRHAHRSKVTFAGQLPGEGNVAPSSTPTMQSTAMSAPGPGGAAPTAKSNAVAAVQPGWGNSAPLQLDLDKQLSRQIGGTEAVEALIRGHEELGGTLININVISKEQVLEAHADPSKYPDLVVRVTGYSAYFKTLSPEYRQQVVDRLLAEG